MSDDWDSEDEERLPLAERLKRGSDRIVNLILHSDLEWIDIQLEIAQLRALCETHRPAKLELFDALYTERFHRIWEQWRGGGEEEWHGDEASDVEDWRRRTESEFGEDDESGDAGALA